MQRDFDTFEIPEDIQATEVTATDDGVKISWSGDSHQSFYPWSFLDFYLKNDRRSSEPIDICRPRFFGKDGPQAEDGESASVDYRYFDSDEKGAVGCATDSIRRNGLVFVKGVPTDSAAPTEALLEKIAFIRQTHYGGFYDFVPDLAMADTAYTNVALAAHTDTTYFSDPAGLQAFHLLSHTDTSGSSSNGESCEGDGSLGGQSLLVDGFHAAELLRREHPEAFDILTKVKLPWHASGNEGITIAPDRLYPVLELEGDEMARVRWNNDDRGVVPFADGDGEGYSPEQWYAAARKWDGILRRKEVEFWFQLEPGSVLIFDNWRVLHGRSAFTGVRRICGGYINRDDFISRWRNTNYPRAQILERIVG